MLTQKEIEHRIDVLKVINYTVSQDISPYHADLQEEWEEYYAPHEEADYKEIASDNDSYLRVLGAFVAINSRYINDTDT